MTRQHLQGLAEEAIARKLQKEEFKTSGGIPGQNIVIGIKVIRFPSQNFFNKFNDRDIVKEDQWANFREPKSNSFWTTFKSFLKPFTV